MDARTGEGAGAGEEFDAVDVGVTGVVEDEFAAAARFAEGTGASAVK